MPGGLSLYIGIDGGGTKSVAIVGAADGVDAPEGLRVLGRAERGSANKNAVGEAKAMANVVAALEAAAVEALDGMEGGGRDASIKAVRLATAGVDRPGEGDPFRDAILAACSRLRCGGNGVPQVAVVNDAYGALASGVLVDAQGAPSVTPRGLEGIALVAGTGTIAFGLRQGNTARAAGWGPAFADAGSGYDFGHRLLSAVARATDGRGPETALTAPTLAALGLAKPEDLIGWAYAPPSWAEIASLAPLVLDAASAGDAVARDIVAACAREVATSVLAVYRRLWPAEASSKDADPPVPCVLTGGLFSQANAFGTAVEDALEETCPAVRAMRPACEAALGALMLCFFSFP